MKKNTEISERILQVIEYLGLSKNDFAKKLNYKRSQSIYDIVNGKSAPSYDFFNKFLSSEYSECIELSWIIDGKGNMLRADKNILREPQTDYLIKTKDIPLVDVYAIGGFGNSDFTIESKNIKEKYTLPIFENKQVDFMIEVRGDSMSPRYSGGDIVACSIIKERTFIQPNKIHVIATHNQGIIIKRLKKSKIKDHLLAVSDNPDYEPFDLPEDEIESIAIVVGGVCTE